MMRDMKHIPTEETVTEKAFYNCVWWKSLKEGHCDWTIILERILQLQQELREHVVIMVAQATDDGSLD